MFIFMNPNDDALLDDEKDSFDEDDSLLQGFGLTDEEESTESSDADFSNYNDENE